MQRRATKLAGFIRQHGLSVSAVARASKYSRKHVSGVVAGQVDPSLSCIVAILSACTRLVASDLAASDLFDLEASAAQRRRKVAA